MSSTPERFVTIWCPDWSAVAAGCPPDEPAAVLSAHRVIARTPAAAAEGVVIGQRRRQAQAQCPAVQLIDHDPARDTREFDAVVAAVTEVAPRLDVVEPGWICLAARGPSRYFGGDEAVADHLVEVIAGMRVPAGVGVADGRFASGVAARLAVRRGVPVVVAPGEAAAFCAPLAIGWLQTLGESEPELVDLFVRLGLRRLGDLAGMPVRDVLGRFGTAGVHALQLASGDDVRPASTGDPAVEERVSWSFDDPVEQSDAVVFVGKRLADRLAGRLAADGRVCTRLVVQLETEHGERSERSWYRPAGLSASAMVERVRWQLDAWMRTPRGGGDEITAGVMSVRLVPDEVRADDGVQVGLWGGQSDADRRAGRAIARLTTLTSEQAVTVPVWQGGRLPGERYRWIPATTVDLDDRAGGAPLAASAGPVPASPAAPWPGSLPAPSPATVYDPPLPVEVVDDAGHTIEVSGRGVVSSSPSTIRSLVGSDTDGWRRGRERRVRAWAGPWPIDQRWWEPARHRRVARFQLVVEQDDEPGDQALLVVAERRRWWVIARYD